MFLIFKIEKSSQCAICMDDFVVAESAKQLPCKHIFHDPCISQWLKIVRYFFVYIFDEFCKNNNSAHP
jgi:hypothetical protein